METREERLKHLNETISTLFALFQTMTNPEIAIYEDWTAKDILGHITFWHESFARNTKDLVNGVKPSPLKGTYSDLNQRCLVEMRTQTVEQIMRRLQEAHKIIQDNILDTKLCLIPYKKGARDYSPEEHLEIVSKHINKHLTDIGNITKERFHESTN